MMRELGKLAERGRLKNFTALAEAVLKLDSTTHDVKDDQALYRTALLLDTVFAQAYRGEKSMAYLAERVNSFTEVLELMAMDEPRPLPSQDAPQPEPDPVPFRWDEMWQGPTATTKQATE